jgi:hypothetical protein
VTHEREIEDLAQHALQLVFDDVRFMNTCNRITFQEMGLHPQTSLGGDDSDAEDFYQRWAEDNGYDLTPGPGKISQWLRLRKERVLPDYITEDDPRYPLYWETLHTVTTHVFATMITKGRLL